MLDRQKTAMAATATNTAVQAPCVDRALSATEVPSMAEPETKVKSKAVRSKSDENKSQIRPTQGVHSPKHLVANLSEQHPASIIDSIDVPVTQLECSNDVV